MPSTMVERSSRTPAPAAITSWVRYTPQWSGLKEGLVTDYVEAHTFSARPRRNDRLQQVLEETLGRYLLPGDDGTLRTSVGEFFDELTAYTNVIISGVARTDLTAFDESPALRRAPGDRAAVPPRAAAGAGRRAQRAQPGRTGPGGPDVRARVPGRVAGAGR